MKKNNIISDWLDQYGNPEIDKFVETQLNQNEMKVTIEYDNEQQAIKALNVDRWEGALWKLDQNLRGIVKHGYIGNREATECEIETYNQCREMLRDAMNDNNIAFDI